MLGMFARRDFLWSAAAATSAMAQRSGPSRKPNLIIFLADDLGCHDIGAWGATDLKTPNIDALAASGTRITNCYAAAPACAPSRAALLTGRYPIRADVAGCEEAVGLEACGANLPPSTKPSGIIKDLEDIFAIHPVGGGWVRRLPFMRPPRRSRMLASRISSRSGD